LLFLWLVLVVYDVQPLIAVCFFFEQTSYY